MDRWTILKFMLLSQLKIITITLGTTLGIKQTNQLLKLGNYSSIWENLTSVYSKVGYSITTEESSKLIISF